MVQDSQALYSSQGEKDWQKTVNKLQGNFAVAVLGMNFGVIFKQQVSLETSLTEIDSQFVRKSGPSLGPISVINPMALLKQLSFTKTGEGSTILPIEWTKITDNKLYQAMTKQCFNVCDGKGSERVMNEMLRL